MQEEVTQKTIALSVKTARVTADVLKKLCCGSICQDRNKKERILIRLENSHTKN